MLIITLPEPKKLDPSPKELPPLSKKWSISEQEIATTDQHKDLDSPTTPLFVTGTGKEGQERSEEALPSLQRQKTTENALDFNQFEHEKTKMSTINEVSSRKMSKSLKNFNTSSKEPEPRDNIISSMAINGLEGGFSSEIHPNDGQKGSSFTISQPNLMINISNMKVVSSQQGITSSRLSRGGGPVQSTQNGDDQKKKKDKISIIEDMKLEVYENELHIINNLNEEVIPLDSLKVSTIHDISKNIQDKFQMDTLDQDEQFLLESKLGNLHLLKEVPSDSRK